MKNILNEVAAYMDLPNGKTVEVTDGAYPFIFCYEDEDDYNKTPYITDLLIGDINSEHEDNEYFENILDQNDTYYMSLYAGRIWPKYKCLAFWENPKNEDLPTIIKMLNNKLHINIDSNTWYINIICGEKSKKPIPKADRTSFGDNIRDWFYNEVILLKDYYTYPNIKSNDKYKDIKQEDILKWKYAHKYESQKINLKDFPYLYE